MALGHWVIVYVVTASLWLWVLRWGGAEWLEGWKAWGLLGWFTGHWSAEQIKLYALLVFLIETVWFCIGLFSPAARFAYVEFRIG